MALQTLRGGRDYHPVEKVGERPMIFTRNGLRWLVNERGFLMIPTGENWHGDEYHDERWILYGWHDLI